MTIRNIFKKTDQPIGRLSEWIGVLTFASGIVWAISWPTSTISYISQNGWGAILLSSIALTCLLMTSMALALIGYRMLRPLPTNPDFPSHFSTAIDNVSRLEIRVEQLISDLENSKSQTVTPKYQSIHEAEEQNLRLKYIENMITGIQENHNNLRSSIRDAFSAQRTKEIYDDITSEIDALIKDLSEIPRNSDDAPDWSNWDMYFNRLKSKLQYLARLSDAPEPIRKEIFDVPPEKFKSQYWSFDDSYMSEDQKHDYKTFRIIAANYCEARSKIHSAILNSLYRSV